MEAFVEEMRSRELIAQITHEEELSEHLSTPQTGYCGFDPTAESLHIGHLVPIMALSRWQKSGHRAIAVLGGGTALIGDPTGKTSMRQILDPKQIDQNIANFKHQVSALLDLSDTKKGLVLNNAEWLQPLQYLPFLREIGSQFSVNRMLTAECFKSRLETGLSFLEFNYMLLQAYDFLHLFRKENCTVQIGGDDQWSNMLAGVDLVRRMSSGKAFCLTFPLLQTSDGRKMGKTEQGAVWLNPDLTSPFDYFQFWRNVPDDMVGLCLRLFTFLPISEIRELESQTGSNINEAKVILAHQATQLIHGEEEAWKAKNAASSLFKAGAGGESADVPEVVLDGALVSSLAASLSAEDVQVINIIDLLISSKIVPSKTEARRLVEQGGVFIDGVKVPDIKQKIETSRLKDASGVLLRKGKKYYYRLRISE